MADATSVYVSPPTCMVHTGFTVLFLSNKIIQYIDRLRADTRRLTSESISKEVEKLDEVYRDACTKKQYSAAVNAIRLKSQLLGFLVEKKEVQHSTLDAMNDDDLSKYLDQIKTEHELN